MDKGKQITSVDEIAHNDEELVKKAEELTDLKNLVLDRTETVGKNFETVDSSVCAILVKKHSDPGAVRVDAPGMPSVETGPQKNGFDIMVINPGQTCMFYSNPTVRYFKRA